MFGDQNFESDIVKSFFDKIDNWVNDSKLKLDVSIDKEKVEEIMSLDDFEGLTYDNLMSMAYTLSSYSYMIQEQYNECKTILDFSTESLWYIMSKEDNSDIDKIITKWEDKFYKKVRRSPLAQELNKLKMYANAKVNYLQSKIEHVKRNTEIISNIANRRRFENVG